MAPTPEHGIDRSSATPLDGAGIRLIELIGDPLAGAAWEVVRSRRMIMRAGGVDVAAADALLDDPAFGRRRADAARYEAALDGCVDLQPLD